MPDLDDLPIKRFAKLFGAGFIAGGGCGGGGGATAGAGAGFEPFVDGCFPSCFASNAALKDIDAFVFAVTAARVMLERRRSLNGEAGFGAAGFGAEAGLGFDPFADG